MSVLVAPPEMHLALDNDVFTHLQNRRPYVLTKISEYFASTQTFPAIPATIIFETSWGNHQGKLSQSEYKTRQARIDELISQSGRVLSFDRRAAEIAAYVFARLSQSARNKHWKDLFVMATAIAHDHGVATGNKKDFEMLAKHLPEDVYLRLAIWKP